MLINRETDYAIRILRSLATGEKLSTTELSEQQEVPLQFAYKIIKKLERANLIRILRGAAGGCVLERDLSQVSLYELMAGMEERSELSACMRAGYQCAWRARYGDCTVHSQLSGIQRKIDDALRAVSLKSLLSGEEESHVSMAEQTE